MSSSRDHERRLESVASVAKAIPEFEDDTVLPREMSMNQGTEHKNVARSDVHSYYDIAKSYRDQRDEARREALAYEEDLAYARDELATARNRIGELEDEISVLQNEATTSFRREQTAGTATSASAANWRPRGHDPADLLTGKNVDDYGPWRYAVDEKFDIDAPLFPNDRSKVRYALKMMKNPIFSDMQIWVADTRLVTFDDLMDEVEHYMSVHLQQREAKRDLQTISQRQGEKISEYYHRIRSLWQKAKTPEDDRVDQFLTTMSPSLSTSLLSKSYTRVRDLLDKARVIEDRKRDISYIHPRQQRGQPLRQPPRETTPLPTTRSTSKTDTKSLEKDISGNHASEPFRPNRSLAPAATKPEGWVGKWHNSENNPKRLTDELKVQLQREGRCWACRGSGHRAHDSVCPQQGRKLSQVSTKGTVESSGSELDSEKE
jgi:hypothetical protein